METIGENEVPEMTNVINSSPLKNTNLEKSIVLLKFRHFVFNNTLSDDKILKHLEFTYRFLTFSIKNIEEKSSDIVKLAEISLEKPGISHFLFQNLKLNNFVLIDLFSKSLILDLDETLVSICSPYDKPDHIIKYLLPGKIDKVNL